MTESKPCVLVVDNSPEQLTSLLSLLETEYQVKTASSGEKAIHFIREQSKPDAVLLDVSLKDMDGYETCRLLKTDNDMQFVDIIFISSYDTIDEKLAGYEAGGSDYVIKPLNEQEILKKLRVAIHHKQARQQAIHEKEQAEETAMIAMTSAAELGNAFEGFRKCYSCDTVETLGTQVVHSLMSYGLSSTIRLETEVGHHYYNHGDQPISALEKELIDLCRKKGRIFEYKNRLIINFHNLAVLIPNLPDEDFKRGRIRDNIAIFLASVSERLRAIEYEDLYKGHQKELSQLTHDIVGMMEDLSKLESMQKECGMRIMDDLSDKIEHLLTELHITESQEKAILAPIHQAHDAMLANFEYGVEVDQQLHELCERLEKYQ
ncbi:response regulator [Algicola sagamiensis]|uniref:response regulator n=1 Tax=Algicola sagamiensis TaxID=163869 RepID=UPI0003765F29|nr:response regulator [Algicola sagamiensis]